jgi:hypothetical protein
VVRQKTVVPPVTMTQAASASPRDGSSGAFDPADPAAAADSATGSSGVHIVGEGATELVHVGQMALLGGMGIDAFVENTFNFPTLAEAYRVAALDLVEKRAR